jgi:hypothetical protein
LKASARARYSASARPNDARRTTSSIDVNGFAFHAASSASSAFSPMP